MIREARNEDLRDIVRLACRFVREVRRHGSVPVREEVVAATTAELMSRDDAVALVCESEGVVVGTLVGIVFRHYLSGEQTAFEVFWWVEPAGHRSGARSLALLRAFEAWSRKHGATVVQMTATLGSKAGRIYQRLGYDEVETAYQRRL